MMPVVSAILTLVGMAAALACSGCMLIAHSLPGDQYEVRLSLLPVAGGTVRGDLKLEEAGRDVRAVRGRISGLEPGHVYRLHVLMLFDCGADHTVSAEFPQIALPAAPRSDALPIYFGPLPDMRANSEGVIDVDSLGAVGGWNTSATPSEYVLAETGSREWIACGRAVGVKTREAWGHPKM
jgi:hypothetical protein